MTALTAHRTNPDVHLPQPRFSRRRALAAGAAGVLVVSGIAAFALVGGGGNAASGAVLDARRVVATQAACQQWVASPGAPGGLSSSGWCTDMTGWMSARLAEDPTLASSMWNSPQTMLAACHQWVAATPANPAGCDQMVGWMSSTMGTWDGVRSWDAHMGSWSHGMIAP